MKNCKVVVLGSSKLVLGTSTAVAESFVDSSYSKTVLTLRAGFEPTRGDPNGFQVHRLNHSAIAADNGDVCGLLDL